MESDVLRLSLLVIGGGLIVGVTIHGIWLSRKNGEKKSKDAPEKNIEQELEPQSWSSDKNEESEDRIDGLPNAVGDIDINIDLDEEQFTADNKEPITSAEQFDHLGIGAVRVVSSSKDDSVEPTPHVEPITDNETSDVKIDVEQETAEEKDDSAGKIYASVVTQPKPEYAKKPQAVAQGSDQVAQESTITASSTQESFNLSKVSNSDLNSIRTPVGGHDNYQAPEPPPFLLKKEARQTTSAESDVDKVNETKSSGGIKESIAEQAINLVKRKRSETNRKRKEPKIADDQMRIDFDDEPSEPLSAEVKSEPQVQQAEQEQQQEVLVLNVKAADDSPIPGSALLPMLLTLGFKFGDQDIFHRHVNSNGKGPVLFSLANMFKPGNFDIDNLENFTTQGVSLFMILPIEGEPHQVFNMMHNAARKISDEFSAQIYDGRRTLLTKQSLQQYVEKIREFERQRMLKR